VRIQILLATLLSTSLLPAWTSAEPARTPATRAVDEVQGEGAPPASPTRAADALYPPVRHATVVFGFSLPDDVKADTLRKALSELSTKDADCKLRYGPMKATARPSKVFVLVEAPATVDAKDVLKAVKKGSAGAEALAFTCFQSSDRTLGRGLGAGMPGMTPRDWVLGMSNDLRWCEARGGFLEFFFAPGKLTSEVIADRLTKLTQPFGIQDVGKVVEESVTWNLTGTFDAAAAKRAEKALAKLHGVREARVDAGAKTLVVRVALEDLTRGAPPIPMPGAEFDALAGGGAANGGEEAPRMRFDTNAIWDTLLKESIGVAAAAPTEPAAPAAPGKGG